MDAHRLFHSASITSLASFGHNASRPLCMFSYTYILEIMDLCIFFFLIYLSCSRFIKHSMYIFVYTYFRNYGFIFFFFNFFLSCSQFTKFCMFHIYFKNYIYKFIYIFCVIFSIQELYIYIFLFSIQNIFIYVLYTF